MDRKNYNPTLHLSEHFTLGEMTKTNTKIENVPNEAQVENLKRLCGWLEMPLDSLCRAPVRQQA